MASSDSGQGKNRKTRLNAKHVPSRKFSRLYAAKHAAQSRVEDAVSSVTSAPVSQAVRKDLSAALDDISRQVRQVAVDEPHATKVVKQLAADVAHVVSAQKVLAAAHRLHGELRGKFASTAHELEVVADDVTWHLRNGDFGGELISACNRAWKVVSDAEVLASRERNAA